LYISLLRVVKYLLFAVFVYIKLGNKEVYRNIKPKGHLQTRALPIQTLRLSSGNPFNSDCSFDGGPHPQQLQQQSGLRYLLVF
jgi:hypothetical protein